MSSTEASDPRKPFLTRIANELGLPALKSSPFDTKILYLQRFVRLFAYGATTIVLAVHLKALGFSDFRLGLFMSLTLIGDVFISLLLTLFADGLGRRNVLKIGAALMVLSGMAFVFSGNYWLLLAAAIFGVISPNGNEIGPFKAIEESTLAHLTPSAIRSDIFAWYGLFGTAGNACGLLICGWLVQVMNKDDNRDVLHTYRTIFLAYAALGILKLVLACLLTANCELETKPENADAGPKPNGIHRLLPSISPESRIILIKLCLLFFVDSLGSGLVPQSLIVYFFEEKFHLAGGALGTLFFVTNIISSASNLAASSISKRIGLVRTMVFTHLPSAIMLALIPAPPWVWLAMTFLILRASTSTMDQAPRSAFLSAVVLANERTSVMGIVNVVKTISSSAGPTITGTFAGKGLFWLAFMIAGSLKASYDLGMLWMFQHYQTRESREQMEYRAVEEEEELGALVTDEDDEEDLDIVDEDAQDIGDGAYKVVRETSV